MLSFWPPKVRRLDYAGAALFAGAAQPETACPSWAHLGPKLLAISSCVLALSSAISSLSTYLGVYVQELLGLPSLDMAGEEVALHINSTAQADERSMTTVAAPSYKLPHTCLDLRTNSLSRGPRIGLESGDEAILQSRSVCTTTVLVFRFNTTDFRHLDMALPWQNMKSTYSKPHRLGWLTPPRINALVGCPTTLETSDS